MKAGFIGAGKVGFSLGKFFVQGGVRVTGYHSRHRESAQEAALFTGTKAYDTVSELIDESDAIFLTVPDGVIASVFGALSELHISGKIFCHCSGALTASEAFPEIESLGAYGYSVHPLFPVSSKLTSYRELTGAFFCLEGNGPHIKELSALIEGLGGRTHIISGSDKTLYHAACSVSSNLVCALAHMSVEMLRRCDFTEREAREALAPLMKSNMEHIIKEGAVPALTGPVERGDAGTVEKHLKCFTDHDERELYRLASEILVDMAESKNPGRDYTPVINILKGEDQDA